MGDTKKKKASAPGKAEDKEKSQKEASLEAEEAREEEKKDAAEAPREGQAQPAEDSADGPGEVENIEPSDSLKSALQEALESVETREKGEDKEGADEEDEEKEEAPPAPSKKELELKVQIIDLQHKVRGLEKEVETKIKEIKQNYDEAKRMQKQLEDYKVRVKREKADWFNYGHEPIIREMLPVMDNLERALEHADQPEGFEALREGIDLTLRQLLQVMGKFGVEKLEALGKPFDPKAQEAMATCEDAEKEPNTVVEEHQKGYMLKDRLIRPSLVVVSCASEDKSKGSEGSAGDKDKAGSEIQQEKAQSTEEGTPSQEAPDNKDQV